MSKTRALFVAYEEWETVLGDGFLRNLKQKFPSMELALVVADPFQVQNRKNRRKLGEKAFADQYETYVIFEEISEWQEIIRNSSKQDAPEQLKLLVEREGIEGLDQILRSEIHFYPRERTPMYARMTYAEISTAARLVMEKCVSAVNEFRPNLIVSVGEQYLVKNFIASLSETRGIELEIIRPARFKDFHKCDPFLMPNQEKKPVPLPKISGEIESLALEKRGHGVLYELNLASKWAPFFERARARPVLTTIRVLGGSVFSITNSMGRIILKSQIPSPSLRYFVPSFWKTFLYIAAKPVRQLLYIWSRNQFITLDSLPEKFFVVPLHYRPESSTLTYGWGLEDEDVIERVADVLRSVADPVFCVVLEHPAMVEDRKIRWYRQNSKETVMFVDPSVSTQWLMRESIGVITLSGTAALEASVAGIPAHVLGRPEFSAAIKSTGPERLPEFILKCIEGSEISSQDSAIQYLAEIQERGWRGNLGWPIASSAEERDRAVQLITEMVLTSSSVVFDV